MRHGWLTALSIAAFLAVVVGVSVLVGYVGSPKTSFNWTLASVVGTAVGTTLLALATFWLAQSTRSEVRATQALAEASDRPFVVLLPGGGFSGSPDNGMVTVTLLNVGQGPAVGVLVSAKYQGHEDWQPTIEPKTIPAIASNNSASVELPTHFPEPHAAGGVRDQAFSVDGTYTDRSMVKRYPITTLSCCTSLRRFWFLRPVVGD